MDECRYGAVVRDVDEDNMDDDFTLDFPFKASVLLSLFFLILHS
jgi:hypothetical protein